MTFHMMGSIIYHIFVLSKGKTYKSLDGPIRRRSTATMDASQSEAEVMEKEDKNVTNAAVEGQ